MLLLLALLALLPATLAQPQRAIFQCAANAPGGAPHSFLAQFFNAGLNQVQVRACTAAAPTNQSCAPAAGALLECGLTVPPNGTMYVNFSTPLPTTAASLTYLASQPFSYHPLASSPPLAFAAADTRALAIPYPAPGALLCDSAADCAPGAQCPAAPAPPRCSAPPAPPSPPPPAPVPSPSPAPAAGSTCTNITSDLWEQSSLGAPPPPARSLHTADAYISLVSLAGGAFTWSCKASHKPCPGGVQALNGTGQFSASGAGFTLTPAPGSGVGPISGTVNNTFSCSTLALLSGLPSPLQWSYYGPAPRTPFDTRVSAATYLGSPAHPFAATGVAILGAQLVAVAGNGLAAGFPGARTTLLLGANASSNATLLLVSTASATASSVVGVVKLGARLDHVRASSGGLLAVAGSFGVALLRFTPPGALAVVWVDSLSLATPGDCGVCCSSASGGSFCRVDIGEDGTVAASLAAATADGRWLWAAWAPGGARLRAEATPAASLTDVFVDSAHAAVGASWFSNGNTGKEPMVMPALLAADAASGAELYRAFPWSARVYRSPGPCNGDVADGRILAARVGRDGTLLVAGRSDGGNSPFHCGLRNANRTVPFAEIDDYTNPSNMQAQAITNFLRMDAGSGEVQVAQIQVARLPSGARHGNTLLTVAAQADAAGNVYLLQNAACCLPNMPNLTVNGQALNGWSDAAALHVLDARLAVRHTWTHFVRPNSTGNSEAVDIDVRGELVALVMQTSTDSVTAAPIAGTASNVGGARVGYLVVLPTVGAAGA